MGDNLAEKIQEGLLDVQGDPVVESVEGDKMTIFFPAIQTHVHVDLTTGKAESKEPNAAREVQKIIDAPEDTDDSVYALLLQEFIDENREYGVARVKVDRKTGIATIRQEGVGSVKVNLQTGEIDPGKLKPDAKLVVNLKAKMQQTPVPTEVVSIVPISVGDAVQPSQLTVEDVINYINPKATKAEAWMFLQYCRSKGLNPLTREVHLAIFDGDKGRKCNFIAGKESFTTRAEANPYFDGMKAGIVVQNEAGLDYREGTFLLEGETLLGGWAEVFRKDRTLPFKSAVTLKEYDAKQNVWVGKPATMIRKVALVQALREAFPGALGGMYDQSEIPEA